MTTTHAQAALDERAEHKAKLDNGEFLVTRRYRNMHTGACTEEVHAVLTGLDDALAHAREDSSVFGLNEPGLGDISHTNETENNGDPERYVSVTIAHVDQPAGTLCVQVGLDSGLLGGYVNAWTRARRFYEGVVYTTSTLTDGPYATLDEALADARDWFDAYDLDANEEYVGVTIICPDGNEPSLEGRGPGMTHG